MSGWMNLVGWILLICGLVVIFISIPSVVVDLRKMLREPESLGFDEHLTDVNPKKAHWLTRWSGGRWGRYGWFLSKGESGEVHIKLPGSAPGTLKLRLWMFDPGQLSVSLVDESGERHIPTYLLNGRILSYRVSGSSSLRIIAVNQLEWEQLVLDRIAAVGCDEAEQLPTFWPIIVGMGVGLAGWGVILCQKATGDTWNRWLGCTLVLIAAAWGFHLRWELFEMARFLPTDSDVVATYMPMARSFRWFSSETGFYSGAFGQREPLYLAILNTWFRLWGDSFPAIKWYSVCASMGLVVAMGLFIWKLSGLWWHGAIAAWVAAVNPALIDESVRGMRVETMSLLFLATVCAWVWGRGWHGAVVLGTNIGLISVLRTAAFSIFLPLVWLGWVCNWWCTKKRGVQLRPAQWTWMQLILVSFVALAIYGPYLYSIYRSYGDVSWPVNFQARWNANVEFPQRLGTPGFPSRAEFENNPYSGPPITYGQYLFGLHSLPELAFGQLKGWVEATVYMGASATPGLKELIFLLHASGLRAVLHYVSALTVLTFVVFVCLLVIGWATLWKETQLWWVPFLSLWGTWYAAYMYHARLIEPFRQTGHVYPLLMACQVWGIIWILRRRRLSMLSLPVKPNA